MATPLRINGISGNQHTTSEYVVATLRILGQDEYGPAEALITRELHIVDKLEANMLLEQTLCFLRRWTSCSQERFYRLAPAMWTSLYKSESDQATNSICTLFMPKL